MLWVLRPAEIWPVYVPAGARIESLPAAEGDQVPEGSVLISLHLPELKSRRQAAQTRVESLRQQAAAFAGHLRDDGRWLVETWLDEESVQRVSVGNRALFITDGTGGPPRRPHSHAREKWPAGARARHLPGHPGAGLGPAG